MMTATQRSTAYSVMQTHHQRRPPATPYAPLSPYDILQTPPVGNQIKQPANQRSRAEKISPVNTAPYLLPLTRAAHSFGVISPAKRAESADCRKGGSVSLGCKILATAASHSPASTSRPIWSIMGKHTGQTDGQTDRRERFVFGGG